MTDVLNIAAMDAAQKLAYAKATGSVLLAVVRITEPVLNIELAMPSGYDSFELETLDIHFEDHEVLNFELSQDGGSTFWKDEDAFSGYEINQVDAVNNGAVSASIVTDGYGWLSRVDAGGNHVLAKIFPGSMGTNAVVRAVGAGGPITNLYNTVNVFSHATGKCDYIRLCTFYEENFTSGTVILRGRAAP